MNPEGMILAMLVDVPVEKGFEAVELLRHKRYKSMLILLKN